MKSNDVAPTASAHPFNPPAGGRVDYGEHADLVLPGQKADLRWSPGLGGPRKQVSQGAGARHLTRGAGGAGRNAALASALARTPVFDDMSATALPHRLILGEAKTGKTLLVASMLEQLISRNPGRVVVHQVVTLAELDQLEGALDAVFTRRDSRLGFVQVVVLDDLDVLLAGAQVGARSDLARVLREGRAMDVVAVATASDIRALPKAVTGCFDPINLSGAPIGAPLFARPAAPDLELSPGEGAIGAGGGIRRFWRWAAA